LGIFEFNGGALNVRTSIVANAKTFFVGDGVSSATLNLVSNGVHSFSDGLTLRANSSLIGNGSITGVVTVLSGSTIAPGTSIGKISLSNAPVLAGTTLMEISKTGATFTCDQIQVAGTLTYGGTLTVTNIGPDALVLGTRFQLFSATSYAGSFSSITLPPLGLGLIWTNKLLVDGSIEVVLLPGLPGANYSGNGNAGFGGAIGQGTLRLSDNGTTIFGEITKGPGPFNDVLVIYIDSKPGGFYDTSLFKDNKDPHRMAISGYNNDADFSSLSFPTSFPPDFIPDYAIALAPFFGGIWELNPGGPDSLIFAGNVNLLPLNNNSPTYTFSFNVNQIGLATNCGCSFRMLGTYIAPSAYRSTEALPGNVSGTQGWNPFTVTAFATYTISSTPPRPQITSLISLPPNGFKQINARGNGGGLTYEVQAASNLTAPISWLPIGSNTANGSGMFQFVDTNAPTFPGRFYRLRQH
jgi:hypothetical protein